MFRKSKNYRILCYISMVCLICSLGVNALASTYMIKYGGQREQQLMSEPLEGEKEGGSFALSKETLQKECEVYYQKKLEELLSPVELTFLAQRQWECIVSVNGQEVNSASISMSGPRNVRVMIGEVALKTDILPETILKQGSIEQPSKQEALTDYINVISGVPYEVVREEVNGNVRYYYEFKEVPSGTMIVFQFGTILKEQFRNKDAIKEGRLDIIVK